MLCKNPFMKGIIPCPCESCLPCRTRKAALWTHRLTLERSSCESAAFVTLSYTDAELEDLSVGDWSGSRPLIPVLVPKHAQNWLKRFRKEIAPRRIRFYMVGEYGDKQGRPHYHFAIFGFPGCQNGRTNHLNRACCSVCSLVQRTWPFGSVDVGELNEKSTAYIAGYVAKKLGKEDSCRKRMLLGRTPEFSRMSLRPGIGANAVKILVTSSVQRRMGTYVKESIDAPVVLKKSGSIFPLGRYLRRKWREALNRDQDTPPGILEGYLCELQRAYAEAAEVSKRAGVPSCFITPRDYYFQENAQKIKILEKKKKILHNSGVF